MSWQENTGTPNWQISCKRSHENACYLHLSETTEADNRRRQQLPQHLCARKPQTGEKASEWIDYLHARYRTDNFNQWRENHPPSR